MAEVIKSGTENGQNSETNHAVEDAAASRSYLRSGESLNSELIATAESPAELFMGLRRLEGMLEDTIIPQGLSERYTPPRDATIMYEKSKSFEMTIEELQKLGIIIDGTYKPYKDGEKDTYIAQLKDDKFLSLALKVKQIPVYFTKDDGTVMKDQDGDPIERGIKTKIIVGSPEQRAENAKANEMGAKELGARDVMGEHIGLRINEEVRDSYETMSAYMHGGRVPKFTTEQLRTLFNMPSLKELREGKELEKSHELGDQLEEAMFCYVVMLSSNSKERMLDLLKRPGATDLIFKMAEKRQAVLRKEKGDPNLKYGYDDWRKEFVGDVDSWVPDYDPSVRTVTTADKEGKYKKSRELGKTWRYEATSIAEGGLGVRGKLTRWSNIAAWEGNPGEFGEDKEDAFIIDLIGKEIVDSVEASWIAATFLRVIGAYSSEGFAALPDGTSLLPLGEDRYISGDDFGKAYALMFNCKEGKAGRPSGLKDMIGKIPDLAINLFDWAQVVVGEEEIVQKDGSVIKLEKRRSIMDAWLGTAKQLKRSLLTGEEIKTVVDPVSGELIALDLVTGKPIELQGTQYIRSEGIKIGTRKDEKGNLTDVIGLKAIVPEEGYTSLGKLAFKSLPRRFHGTYTVMQWLMGNGEKPTGVNIEALKTDVEYDDFKLNSLKKIKKYVGIVMNPVVLSKGSMHLYTDPIGDAKIIQKNYFRNLMIARINSVSFAERVLNIPVKLFVPSGGTVEVPAPVLVRRFIEEALKPNPTNESEIKKRYVDENSELRKSSPGGTPGIAKDVYNILIEKFEPKPADSSPEARVTAEREKLLMNYVGKVTGRKRV